MAAAAAVIPSRNSGTTAAFRKLLPIAGNPRFSTLAESTAQKWYNDKKDLPALKDFLSRLEARNLVTPFRGLTSDGNVQPNLFNYAAEEGAPIGAMLEAAKALLGFLSPEQRQSTLFDSVENQQIRLWSNPEFYVNEGGLRLDECSVNIQRAVHRLLQSSLSRTGYEKVNGCCLVNGFLGALLNGERVLNQYSYNFRLFGLPDAVRPWGYTFFGHHLCIAVVIAGSRMVIGPTFMGAEPDVIDVGPHAGLHLFTTERTFALKLMQSLSPYLKSKATLCGSVLPKDLPEGRWAAHDERHLGGARHDNRIVPYEGCRASLLSEDQKKDLVKLFIAFNDYYPERVLEHRLAAFRHHLDETYFAWIGECKNDAVFYFRIHSPVAFMEFDCHSGVFLTNETPDKCHIHTINRIPNRGDYGRALVEQYGLENQVSALDLKTTELRFNACRQI